MSWKKMILGEKMPDKDDPKYKERYENEVETGRKFARWSGIDRFAAKVQKFANEHRNLFLTLVFGTVICSFTFNAYRFAMVYKAKNNNTTATQRQEDVLKAIHAKRQAQRDSIKMMNLQIQKHEIK